jgi:hypothetical protein
MAILSYSLLVRPGPVTVAARSNACAVGRAIAQAVSHHHLSSGAGTIGQ